MAGFPVGKTWGSILTRASIHAVILLARIVVGVWYADCKVESLLGQLLQDKSDTVVMWTLLKIPHVTLPLGKWKYWFLLVYELNTTSTSTVVNSYTNSLLLGENISF